MFYNDGVIRIMSFNIRYKNIKDGENNWEYRKDKVVSMISFHGADIAGLQEVEKEQADYLHKNLPGCYSWIGVGRKDGKEEGEYCAVFYRDDLFRPVSSGTYWLSETPDCCGSIGWDAMLPRILTHVVFEDKRDNRTFIFINTHFDHKGSVASRNSAIMLKKIVNETGKGTPVIITGDFNCTGQDETYRIITAKETGDKTVSRTLSDAMYISLYDHHGPSTTFHDFGNKAEPIKIDHIFVDNRVRVVYHAVLPDHWDGKYPSDHMPVIADVALL